jgi:hypothetical protein
MKIKMAKKNTTQHSDYGLYPIKREHQRATNSKIALTVVNAIPEL